MPNFMNWNDPGVALVTGAAAGIGNEFARQLASQGFDTILVDRQGQKLEALASELSRNGGNHETLVADLSLKEGINAIEARVRKQGNLDVLVNNAGFSTMDLFQDLDPEIPLNMLKVHVETPVRLSHAAVKTMIPRKRGVIINVASIAAYAPLTRGVVYSSTKAFLRMFSESLQLDLQGTGVKVQALCPGLTRTEILKGEYIKNAGFEMPDIFNDMWMNAKDVVQISLDMVKTKYVTVIPGADNIDNVQGELNKEVRKLKRLERKLIKEKEP